MSLSDPSCRILTVSASLESALAFIERVRGCWEPELTDKETTALSELVKVPWTISNKYYSANVHFAAHSVRGLSPNLIRDVPAVVFVWTKGEAYRDDVERLARDMRACEPEVSLAVRVNAQSTTTTVSTEQNEEEEEDGEIDDFLSSHGFEYVSVTNKKGKTMERGYSLLAGVPDFPRVIDALSSIMWSSMVSRGGERAMMASREDTEVKELARWLEKGDLDVWAGDGGARSESPEQAMGFEDDFGGSYASLESDDDDDLPTQAEVAATHARIFWSEDVIGRLEEMRGEIAAMEDEDERRRAAAQVALGVVYGL